MRAFGIGLLTLALCTPVLAQAKPRTIEVDCTEKKPDSINEVIERADEGDTLEIIGTCTETVVVNKGLTLDGGGSARIIPAAPTDVTVSVTARGVTLTGLLLESPAPTQVNVFGGTLLVDGCVIRNATSVGVSATGSSVLTLVNSTVSENRNGVFVLDSSAGRVGIRQLGATVTSPNVITSNQVNGIAVASNSNGEINGNTITNNLRGVTIAEGARARVANNTIQLNAQGIVATSGAVLALADPDPAALNPLFTIPNIGGPPQVAIVCVSGVVTGRVGGFLPAVRALTPPGTLVGAPGLAPNLSFCQDMTVP